MSSHCDQSEADQADKSNLLAMSRGRKDHESSRASTVANRSSKMKGKSTQQKIDAKARLEKSRQSARECRARKKLRYQYLEDLATKRELAVFALRKELQLNLETLIKLVTQADGTASSVPMQSQQAQQQQQRQQQIS